MEGNNAPPEGLPEGLQINFVTAAEVIVPDTDPMSVLDRGYRGIDLGVANLYNQVMYETVGSSHNYHQLGSLCMVAAAIQHRWLPLTWAPREKLRANLYATILGRTSFDHKSTALLKVHDHMPWEQMPHSAALPATFTEEGLYKELSESPMGLIVRDEIGILFASRARKYTEFVVPFLTDVYGGYLHSKRLSSASYQGREAALTIIGATTYSEFAGSTTERDWDSGWLVRWLFGMPDEDYDPTKRTRVPNEKDVAALSRFRQHIAELNQRDAGPMRARDDAHEYLTVWREKLMREAMANEDRHERVDAIIERYATYAYKFAMIVCAARGDGELIDIIHASDGARLAENYMTNVFRLYAYQKAHRLTGSTLQKSLGLLHSHPGGMTRRQFGQHMNLKATARDEALDYLLGVGAVLERTEGRTTKLFAVQAKLPPIRLNMP